MAMTCPHHVMWVIPVEHGLHQCIHCKRVVARTDVTPAFQDLPRDYQERWERHEREGSGEHQESS
jgi:hypothetical protein